MITHLRLPHLALTAAAIQFTLGVGCARGEDHGAASTVASVDRRDTTRTLAASALRPMPEEFIQIRPLSPHPFGTRAVLLASRTPTRAFEHDARPRSAIIVAGDGARVVATDVSEIDLLWQLTTDSARSDANVPETVDWIVTVMYSGERSRIELTQTDQSKLRTLLSASSFSQLHPPQLTVRGNARKFTAFYRGDGALWRLQFADESGVRAVARLERVESFASRIP